MTKALYSIVGMKHRGTLELVNSLPAGEPLRIVREPDNQHDPNAVQVWARDVHIGFVKGTEARGLAAQMDRQGKPQAVGTYRVTPDRWPQIEVEE